MSAQQHSAQAHQAHPQQHQDPQRGSQHQVSQEEPTTHGGTGGVAWREGVAVYGNSGKHVHSVVRRPGSADHSFNHGNQDNVQQQPWTAESGRYSISQYHAKPHILVFYFLYNAANWIINRFLVASNRIQTFIGYFLFENVCMLVVEYTILVQHPYLSAFNLCDKEQ